MNLRGFEMTIIDEDIILVLVRVIIIISLFELLIISITKRIKNIFKESFFYNVSSGIFIMASLLSFAKNYLSLCLFFLMCSGLFHFYSLIVFIRRKN